MKCRPPQACAFLHPERTRIMDKEQLRAYLATRRAGWPYEALYHIEDKGNHRFFARIGDDLAGFSWAETSGREARMHLSLKPQYAEYGIGTELLELLMADLRESGFRTVRYETELRYYSVQIYRNLGFEVESRDAERIAFVWRAPF